MRKHHTILYLVEFGVIGGGFALLLAMNPTFYMQLVILGFILVLYVIIGLIHHRSHRDISMKVVLEYILVSALIFALFVFLNVSKI
ncbi:MAG: hypothetical protein Q7T54_04075 [Candidatus Levybacteria bacterium]|nr:hypothetical protein [Candidatus Levybacteria bacterium]